MKSVRVPRLAKLVRTPHLTKFFTYLVVGLLARSRYPEGPATGHLYAGFSWFPCVYKRMLRWFQRLQVATTCFSCSPPDLNLFDPYFIFIYMHNNQCHRVTAHLQLCYYYYYKCWHFTTNYHVSREKSHKVSCLGSTKPARQLDMGPRNIGLVPSILAVSLITVGEI